MERIAVLQARTNNVINQRVSNGLVRPMVMPTSDDVYC